MPGFELFGEAEKAEVQKVLDTGVLMRYGFDGMRNGHWKALELEKALAKRMEVAHVHLVSSGTAALTVALQSAGIGAGDEIIMPTFTFVASFESILAVGAIPIIVDVDDTLTLNPAAVAKAVTDKTRAVMPVHMCGSMADLAAIKAICDTHDLLLVEDACQAIGGSYEGKPLGSYGDMGCFSFDYVKTITCGEGGAFITNNKKYYTNAHEYSDHGHDHMGSDRGAELHPKLGYNFRISELNAAVGCAQVKRLDEFIEIQQKYYTILYDALATINGVTFRRIPEGGVQNYCFLNFFLPTEELAREVHRQLVKEGVAVCFYWFDNNWHYYKKWDHLFELKSFAKLPEEIKAGLPDYTKADFSASDFWIGRTVSSLIKIGWSEAEVTERAAKMASVIKRVLEDSN